MRGVWSVGSPLGLVREAAAVPPLLREGRAVRWRWWRCRRARRAEEEAALAAWFQKLAEEQLRKLTEQEQKVAALLEAVVRERRDLDAREREEPTEKLIRLTARRATEANLWRSS
jgi:hypothetical protein